MAENNDQNPIPGNEDLEQTSSELEQEGIVIENKNTPSSDGAGTGNASNTSPLSSNDVQEELLSNGGVEILKNGERIDKEEGSASN